MCKIELILSNELLRLSSLELSLTRLGTKREEVSRGSCMGTCIFMGTRLAATPGSLASI